MVNSFGLKPGTDLPDGTRLVEFVPQGHKVALTDIADGAPILRYGEVIGRAIGDIPRGAWVEDPASPCQFPRIFRRWKRPRVFPPRCLRWKAIRLRATAIGRIVGHQEHPRHLHQRAVRGRTLDFAIKRIREDLLPRYPNVDDVVAVTHAYGCGVAIGARSRWWTIRTLQSLATHPNFGGEV